MIARFFRLLLIFLLLTGTMFMGCKKDNGNAPASVPPPVDPSVNIKGVWVTIYHVAANIYVNGPLYNDTLLSKHNESLNFKTDSVYSDNWYGTRYDQTQHRAVFSIYDSV